MEVAFRDKSGSIPGQLHLELRQLPARAFSLLYRASEGLEILAFQRQSFRRDIAESLSNFIDALSAFCAQVLLLSAGLSLRSARLQDLRRSFKRNVTCWANCTAHSRLNAPSSNKPQTCLAVSLSTSLLSLLLGHKLIVSEALGGRLFPHQMLTEHQFPGFRNFAFFTLNPKRGEASEIQNPGCLLAVSRPFEPGRGKRPMSARIVSV